jgi:hypothetical protein
VKEKKNRRFGVCLENELALTIKKMSSQSKLSMGEIIRFCVDRQLEDSSHLETLTWKKKNTQIHLVFEDRQIKKLSGLAKRTGLAQAEIVRLCLVREIQHIRSEGGIKHSLPPENN